ncbi:zinc finger CCCH domain-containing protein 45 [Iris pallida]|uniref:Zinc finger CCCH domain-containing protein 45 n=1 Tax=Iris pallida TaxID=29817 RepID=A0AAX6EMR4_IRIPA|nr:zinc finger CCCH domain-containing protein 45 [Iris pallida]
MDDDGGLNFDFEGGLEATPAATAPPTNQNSSLAPNPLIPSSDPSSNNVAATQPPGTADPTHGGGGGGGGNQRRSFRQTVCRHWLRSLCMKGEACGFLHQYDKARMPICRFFRLYGECREQDCVYKHTNDDIKECNMYKLGFCPNGPDCRYRHVKLPGPPPPVEEVFQKIQHLCSFSFGSSNRFFQHRNTGYNQQGDKSQFLQGSGLANQQALVKPPATVEPPSVQPPQSQIQQPQPQQLSENQAHNISNGLSNQANRTASPLPQGQSRYFIVKSCNRENLEISVQQGVWATQRSNEAKLNEAFESSENVILVFSVNRTRHFQGCAKMTSKIGGFIGGGNWKYAHGTAHYGRNFSIKWLKLCELSFNKTHHLRNPYNENLPVKISRDCQELEPFIGEQLASLLYLEPDSDLMATLIAAESKREEEKAKGVSTDDASDNPDIVLFEDNEEEEEDEEDSEEEEDGMGQTTQGRGGRGRGGMMWQAPMPLVRGGRPVLHGFPPIMMGADGFGYPDGFAAPDLFCGPPRGGFAPYGPRFSGEFGAGLMFPGRPTQPGTVFPMGGLGMMMGNAGRAPFVGSMAPRATVGRPCRPIGVPPPSLFLHAPPPPNSRMVKKDQRRPTSDRYEPDGGGKGQEVAAGSAGGQGDEFPTRSTFQNEESESEDEAAPRRSRHGEGKKKRRGSEGEGGSGLWETPSSDVQNRGD